MRRMRVKRFSGSNDSRLVIARESLKCMKSLGFSAINPKSNDSLVCTRIEESLLVENLLDSDRDQGVWPKSARRMQERESLLLGLKATQPHLTSVLAVTRFSASLSKVS